jgi:hypothetical protein
MCFTYISDFQGTRHLLGTGTHTLRKGNFARFEAKFGILCYNIFCVFFITLTHYTISFHWFQLLVIFLPLQSISWTFFECKLTNKTKNFKLIYFRIWRGFLSEIGENNIWFWEGNGTHIRPQKQPNKCPDFWGQTNFDPSNMIYITFVRPLLTLVTWFISLLLGQFWP